MAFTRFRPEIWSAVLLTALRKRLVYAAPQVVNRDYEGEIAEAGDTVRITTISDPTVADYVAYQTVITPEELTDAQRTMMIDQAKYFAFRVDDIDKRQAKGNVMSEAMSRAAYKMADQVDRYVAAMYPSVPAANQVGDVTIDLSSPTSWDAEARKAYNEVLVPLKVKLDEANVPTEGRYAVIPPWFHGVILRDPNFINAEKSSDPTALRNGFVGRAAGFDLRMSNNTPSPEAAHNVITAGHNMAISFAEQINKVEAYRPESSFSDAIKGLTLYGGKVIRPEALARCIVDYT